MISAYLDESSDRNKKGCYVVGGLLGRGVPVFELERRWKALRRRPDINIAYFKASHCESGKGEFSKFVQDPRSITPTERRKLDAISQDFLKLIINPVPFDRQHYLCVHGVGIVQQEFYELVNASDQAKAVLGNDPYWLTYHFAMLQCAWLMKQLGRQERVAFVCDKHEQYSDLAAKAFHEFKLTNTEAAEFMATFSFDDDKDCEPLQAADAAVFEVRRKLNNQLGQWPGEVRKQFTLLADTGTMALITRVTKEQLVFLAENHKPGEALNLDVLMNNKIGEDIKL